MEFYRLDYIRPDTWQQWAFRWHDQRTYKERACVCMRGACVLACAYVLACACVRVSFLAITALKYLCINHGDQRVFSIWNIINLLVSSSRFIWIPMLWVYGHYHDYRYFLLSVRGSSLDVRIWHLQTITALKGSLSVISRLNYRYKLEWNGCLNHGQKAI